MEKSKEEILKDLKEFNIERIRELRNLLVKVENQNFIR